MWVVVNGMGCIQFYDLGATSRFQRDVDYVVVSIELKYVCHCDVLRVTSILRATDIARWWAPWAFSKTRCVMVGIWLLGCARRSSRLIRDSANVGISRECKHFRNHPPRDDECKFLRGPILSRAHVCTWYWVSRTCFLPTLAHQSSKSSERSQCRNSDAPRVSFLITLVQNDMQEQEKSYISP